MALIVEDGTGIANADSFLSRDDFKTTCDIFGWEYGADDNAIDRALRRATAHLSEGFVWSGRLVKPRTDDAPQSLAFPRYDLTDKGGYAVPSTSVPKEVVQATAIIAVREIAEPGAFASEFRGSEVVTEERFGDVSFKYDVRSGGISDTKLVLSDVMDKIGQFLASNPASGGAAFGKAVRA